MPSSVIIVICYFSFIQTKLNKQGIQRDTEKAK